MGQDNETSTSNLFRTSAFELEKRIKLFSSFCSVIIQSSFQLTSMNDHCTFLISQQFQFCTLDNSAANNALPKCGQTMELQQQQHCRFGLGLDRFSFNLTGKFNFTFSIQHLHRADPASNIRTSQMQTVVRNGGRTEEQSQA